MTYYNNSPKSNNLKDSSDLTLKIIDAYTNKPISIDGPTYNAMIGFFESRGFSVDSATSISYILMKQSLIDGVNPFNLIDTLKGISDLQLTSLINNILNYNRYKTSILGIGNATTTVEETVRNIVA
jgi:hypothetical protein